MHTARKVTGSNPNLLGESDFLSPSKLARQAGEKFIGRENITFRSNAILFRQLNIEEVRSGTAFQRLLKLPNQFIFLRKK